MSQRRARNACAQTAAGTEVRRSTYREGVAAAGVAVLVIFQFRALVFDGDEAVVEFVVHGEGYAAGSVPFGGMAVLAAQHTSSYPAAVVAGRTCQHLSWEADQVRGPYQ